MIEELFLESWSGPYLESLKTRACAALERGAVVYFPRLSFEIADDEEQFLSAAIADGSAKNISLDPDTKVIKASSLTGQKARQLAAMIERFGASAAGVIEGLLPYRDVERARTSFRPVEVKGRNYSRINDDRLLHIDAFPSRPMRGRRILRFFSNIAPSAPRHWQVGEPFEDFAKAFLPRIGAHLPGKSWVFEKLGITRGRRSLYDEWMLSLHDAAKRDCEFQKRSPHYGLNFPPGSSWLVYTDQVLHAALGGEFALEQTFHLEVSEMVEPERAPLRVLERLSGRTLV